MCVATHEQPHALQIIEAAQLPQIEPQQVAAIDDAKKLAHKLHHALSHPGQERLYFTKVLKGLDDLELAAALAPHADVAVLEIDDVADR